MAVPGPIATSGSPVATGHLCAVTTTLNPVTCSLDVMAGAKGNPIDVGKNVAMMGSTTVPHLAGVPPVCVAHIAPVTTGIPTVLVNKKPVAVSGSLCDLGTITGGIPSVIVGTNVSGL
tara:strand:+ start:1110 stop:1463 length:354 start_codon:yes stop_codon:yes gene_type:complete